MNSIAPTYRHTFLSDASDELQELVLPKTNDSFAKAILLRAARRRSSRVSKWHFNTGLQSASRSNAPSSHADVPGMATPSAPSAFPIQVTQRIFRCLLDVSFVSQTNYYRRPTGVTADGLAQYLADELEQEIVRVGADTVAAFIFEPVVGLAGGVVPAPSGYVKAIREPLGAALFNTRVADAVEKARGGRQTGRTFTGHTPACAAGLAVHKLIEREG